MTSLRVRSSLASLALLAACSAGDDGENTDPGTSSAGQTGGSTGGPTDGGSTGGETSAADTCGDGVLDPDEICDPPGDGCDATCNYVDRSLWTVTRGGPDRPTMIDGIAVDPAGRILVIGSTLEPSGDEWDPTSWLLALDADGRELWQTKLPLEALDSYYPPHLAVDASGIYIQGYGVYRFSPSGAPDWYVWPAKRVFTTLTVADGAVYAGGVELGEYDSNSGSQQTQLVVHRLDAATGASVWDFLLADDTIDSAATGVTVYGDRVFVVGAWSSRDDVSRGVVFLPMDAATGAAGPPVLDTTLIYPFAAGALPSGDLVLAAVGDGEQFVRRFEPGGAVRWTTAVEDQFALRDLAVGPDESLVVVGTLFSDVGPHGFLRALSGAGELTWSAGFAPGDPRDGVSLIGAAFGPDFLVVAGQDFRDPSGDGTGWIRRIDPQ